MKAKIKVKCSTDIVINVKMVYGDDTITEHPMPCESQARVNTTASPTTTATTTAAATSMRGYQNQTTAHCCASISLREKERAVLGNDGGHRGSNPQNVNSSVLGYPYYTATAGADIPCPIAARHGSSVPPKCHGYALVLVFPKDNCCARIPTPHRRTAQ